MNDLQSQLADLKTEVAAAHDQLHLTQARVEQNLQRIDDLKAAAAQFESLSQTPSQSQDASAQQDSQHFERTLAHQSASTSASGVTDQAPLPSSHSPASTAHTAAQPRTLPAKRRGLHSSLEMEEGLKRFWYPVAFATQLQDNKPVPFELFGQHWVMFRNEQGQPACVLDTCAHRACPLSLGKVVNGNIQCAYHGWQFNQHGQCVHMPSTVSCPNIGVSSMACKEQDGFVLVWPGQGPQPELPNLAPPDGYRVHAEIEVCICSVAASPALIPTAGEPSCKQLHNDALHVCAQLYSGCFSLVFCMQHSRFAIPVTGDVLASAIRLFTIFCCLYWLG